MIYKVKLEKATQKELQKLPAVIVKKIIQKLIELEDNPRPQGIKKLVGVDGYRIRIEDYRVLFTINDKNKEISVYRIKHRKEVYK